MNHIQYHRKRCLASPDLSLVESKEQSPKTKYNIKLKKTLKYTNTQCVHSVGQFSAREKSHDGDGKSTQDILIGIQ